MGKPKRKLTSAERKARRERRAKTKIIFMNGKQVRVPRQQLIDGIPVDEFIARNADPIWLHQNGLWHLMDTTEEFEIKDCNSQVDCSTTRNELNENTTRDVPF